MPKANHGVSYARNTGFKIFAAKHIAFLDCSDELTPDYLVEMLNTADNNPDAGWICPIILQTEK